VKSNSLLLLCLTCCFGCNGNEVAQNAATSNANIVQSVRRGDIDKALSKIAIGTADHDLIAAITPLALDSGTVYWGGTGSRRVYFQIEPDKQIWFELSGPAGGNRVTAIGPIEPKTKWTRGKGESITVD
jgi:hypothetical protein